MVQQAAEIKIVNQVVQKEKQKGRERKGRQKIKNKIET